jgi:hypothetical protein
MSEKDEHKYQAAGLCGFEWGTPEAMAENWGHICGKDKGHEGDHRCSLCGIEESLAERTHANPS